MGVAQCNGFRRGAAVLNIAQPAVSRHIKQLEAALDVKLFHRSRSGVTLTEAGQLLLRHSEELFQKLSQIRDELSEVARHASETVHIGAPSSIGEILFAPLAHRVREQAPEIYLTFTESSCRLLGLVKTGHVDLAVLSCTRELNNEEWACKRLVGERVYLVGSPETLDSLKDINVDRVATMPLILTPLPNAQHQYLLDANRASGRKLNVVAEAEFDDRSDGNGCAWLGVRSAAIQRRVLGDTHPCGFDLRDQWVLYLAHIGTPIGSHAFVSRTESLGHDHQRDADVECGRRVRPSSRGRTAALCCSAGC